MGRALSLCIAGPTGVDGSYASGIIVAMQTIAEILTALGGYRVISDHTGIAYPTVAAWGPRGSIPVHYWPDLLLVAQDRGVDLTLGRLVRAHCNGRASLLSTDVSTTTQVTRNSAHCIGLPSE